jgi:hypothetical protein
MIPVVMLAINTGVLSSVFMTVYCLIMTCPSFQYILVAYLMMLTAWVITMIPNITDPIYTIFARITSFTPMAHIALSLLVNIFATSIIALKAWCVHVYGVFEKYFVDCALIGDTTFAWIQEIPQVADGKRDWYPNP